MLSYYEQLRRRHGLPVLPIALYLRVGLDGIGWDVYEEKYWDHRLVAFEYAYVGLPGLDGEQYVAGEHLLGVALTALMRVPPARRAEVHAEALRRLAEARENDYRRYLLLDCLEAYATLDEEQAQELAALLRTERYQGTQAMAMTTFEKGIATRSATRLADGAPEAARGPVRPVESQCPRAPRQPEPRAARGAGPGAAEGAVAPGIGPGGLIEPPARLCRIGRCARTRAGTGAGLGNGVTLIGFSSIFRGISRRQWRNSLN